MPSVASTHSIDAYKYLAKAKRQNWRMRMTMIHSSFRILPTLAKVVFEDCVERYLIESAFSHHDNNDDDDDERVQ